MKAMAKSPDQRYPTAEELRADLLRFSDGRPVSAEPIAETGVMATVGQTQAVAPVSGTQALPAVDGHPDQATEASRRRVRRLALLLAGLVVVLGIIIYFLGQALGYWNSGPSVVVPDVSGQTVPAATYTLGHSGFHVTGQQTVTSNQASGTVVRTQPPAKSSATKGSDVTLYVSGGPVKVTVPDVTNQLLLNAESTLRAHHLRYTVNSEQSSTAVNTVTRQTPAGGQRVGREFGHRPHRVDRPDLGQRPLGRGRHGRDRGGGAVQRRPSGGQHDLPDVEPVCIWHRDRHGPAGRHQRCQGLHGEPHRLVRCARDHDDRTASDTTTTRRRAAPDHDDTDGVSRPRHGARPARARPSRCPPSPARSVGSAGDLGIAADPCPGASGRPPRGPAARGSCRGARARSA